MYRKWAKAAGYESKLPGDVKNRKAAAATVEQAATLDRHLFEQSVGERAIVYSDKAFHQSAIEWLVATDQPLRALENPQFKKMVNVASRATKAIIIPGRKATRAHIKQVFKDYMMELKARLTGPTVIGEVSLTCDAWQASNTDGYFAVTGHWIEVSESTNSQWQLKSALIGFTRVNNAHNGERLGQVLFQIIKRIGIEKKVSHRSISCPIVIKLMCSPPGWTYNL